MKHFVKTLALTCALLSPLHAEESKPYRVGFNNWIGFIAFFAAQEKMSACTRPSARPRIGASIVIT